MNAMFAAKRAALSIAPLAAAALLAGWATSAGAANILVTGDNPLGGTTSAAEPNLAGTIVQDVDTPVSFALNGGTFNATVQSRVVLSVDGTYDFYWRVHDTSFDSPVGTNLAAPGVLGNFRIGNFGIPIAGLNGNYRTDGVGDLGPDNAHVFSGGVFDQYVNFEFSNGLAGGQDSYFMFLDTNATHYARNASFDLANIGTTQISGSFSTFGVAGVPEPASWALMIGGLGLAGAMLRSRRRLGLAERPALSRSSRPPAPSRAPRALA